MRKLAPVFLISVFALASANALAMGDRQKSKAPSSSTTTTPAGTTTTTPPADTLTPAAKDKVATNEKTNPLGTAANCVQGKDKATGKDCQVSGGDSGASSGASAGGTGSAGSSAGSSSSGSSSSAGGAPK